MSNGMLFAELQEQGPVEPADGPFASVAIEQSLDGLLDYAVPRNLVGGLKVGQRVRVPLGRNNRPVHGYVVAISATTRCSRVKPVLAIDDQRVLLPPGLLELARWIARYYCCALGMVLDSFIPAAVKKRVGLEYTPMVRLAAPAQRVQELLEKTRAPKRRAILARLLQLQPGHSVELLRLASEAGSTPATVRKLARAGLIEITLASDLESTFGAREPVAIPDSAWSLELNADQRKVFEELSPRLSGGFSVNLIHGVTGSGKTELYLRCIRQVVAQGRRAIVLVPEIALTPQTVARFTQRFSRVAIVHSALSATARHRFWQQIAQGHADVVVGARSAVFSPVPDLGIIVVDEEHEFSYKQDQAPRYHAREVAIKRAQLESIPLILGSATPSLESWWRATRPAAAALRSEHIADGVPAAPGAGSESPYHLLTLPVRVRGLTLPQIELVDMKLESRIRGHGLNLISRRLEHLLRQTLAERHQAILLLNRRGYSSFVYCSHCAQPLGCRYCDATVTYHRSAGLQAKDASFAQSRHAGQLHCHYCLAVNPLPAACPACGRKLSLFGLGTQRVEEELARRFPGIKFARVDSDTMKSARDYEATLESFARGQIQVMLGTQMIAKGLDYPNVTLVGVISGDTALSLPDFRAAERTFQLITQVAGRAGRGDAPGRVILQTFMPDDPTIRMAIRQDYQAFAQRELAARKEIGLPPITRMVRIILRDEQEAKLHERCQTLAAGLASAIQLQTDGPVTMKGPMPCPINRIAGHHRHQILLYSPSAVSLQKVLALARQRKAFANPEKIAVDVDPVSLL